MNIRVGVVTILLLLLAGLARSAAGNAEDSVDSREWNFRVYLGDSEIGHHRFRLTRQGDQATLTTEANFKVRFLFFTAYQYRHTNNETWQDDCLQRIESHTVANGKVIDVEGEQHPDGFHIDAPGPARSVSGCVKSFAYWNTGILQEDALLNPQTGELMPVEVVELEQETLSVRGRDVPARRYRLITENLSLDVWYSAGSEWLALESTTKDGRTLRYELT
jgi:hypothetical protein